MPIGLVDAILYSAQPLGQTDAAYSLRSSFCGPIEVGGSLYLVLGDNQRPSGATFSILVYKSTDGGVTWTLVSGTTQLTTVFYPWTSVGFAAPRIWVLYATSPDTIVIDLHVVAFNTDTDTWETPLDMPTPTAGTDLRIWDLTVQTDGVLTIVYTIFQSAILSLVLNVWYIRYDGTWGTHTLLSSSDGTAHCGLFLDPATNTTHVFYTGRNVFGIGDLRSTLHIPIDSSGVLGADTELLPPPSSPNQDIYPSLGVGCIWNDQIIVPYNRQPGGPRNPAVFIGTPVSSPVWTSVDLPFSDPDGRIYTFEFAHCVALLDANGNLNVFWGAGLWDADFNVRSPYLFQSINTGGGFATATVYYDSLAVPPTPAVDTTFSAGVFMPSVSLLSTGFGMTFQITLQTPSFGYSAQPNLYFIASSGGTFIPWRVIVDLYGDTQLSALEPAGTPLAVIT